MAQYQSMIPTPSEQVLVECRAFVFLYDVQLNRWGEVGEPNVASRVQLISARPHGSIGVYRIFGSLETTGAITINSPLTDRDEYMVTTAAFHQIRIATGMVYGMRIFSDSEGSKFSVIIQNTLRSLKGSQSHAFSSLAADVQVPGQAPSSPLPPAAMQRVPASAIQDGGRVQNRREFDVQIDTFCSTLSEAIKKGKLEQAFELVRKLVLEKVNLSIKLKNPSLVTMDAGGNTITMRVVVEDKESSGGTFSMKVSPTCTIERLQQEVFDRFGFPIEVQKWIIGKKIPKPKETLCDLSVRQSGTTVFLYLLSGKTVGLRRSDVEQFQRGDGTATSAPRSLSSTGSSSSEATAVSYGTNLRHAASTPNLSAPSDPRGFVTPIREEPIPGVEFGSQVPRRPPPAAASQGDNSNPATLPIHGGMDIKALHNLLVNRTGGQGSASGNPPNPSNEELIVNNLDPLEQQQEDGRPNRQGWTCERCTYINQPTRPGCEMCSAERPQGYVVPAGTMLDERERIRLAAEEREDALFQQAEQTRQREAQIERQRNLDTLLQTAQQSIIPNQEEFDCGICFVPVEPGEGVVLRECLHRFCRECVSEHIRHATDPEVQCPHQDDNYACHATITGQEIQALLSEEDFNKFLNRSLATAENQAANSFHCKTPNCQGWCLYEDNVNTFHCPVCNQPNCLTCKAIHVNMNCKEYQDDLKRRAHNDQAARKTKEFLEGMVAGGNAMHCPRCNIILVKKDGCDWMKCSMCRTEICWATRGPRWGPGGTGDISGGCKCRVGGKKCHPHCKNCH
ncbi:ranBP-type and C3HC4-type zinc finger-containing protein 1-like [Montipora foliosa]|uniref:ranBP-type and C3HC4-type zinc finger-containing protein 1-like n=1 Tax=Montipora foliosa TaxID=591990 RepID=UPI0035F15EBB